MEEVRVITLRTLFLECENMESFHWFSRLLKDHVTDAGMVDGCSVPLFILKSLAYMQEKCASFVSPDMRLLIQGIADAACVVGANEDLNRNDLLKMASKPMKAFNEDTMKVLHQLSDQVLSVVREHGDVIRRLQKQQQKCWSLEDKVEKKSKKLSTFYYKHADRYDRSTRSMPGKHGKKLNDLLHRYWEALDEHLDNRQIYQEITFEEADLRPEMLEIAAEVKDKVTAILEEKIKESVECLMTAIQTKVHPAMSTKKLTKKMQSIDARRLAEVIYSSVTKTYAYPTVEDYNVGTDLLPDAKQTESEGKHLLMDFQKDPVKEERMAPKDFETFNVLLDVTDGYNGESCFYKNYTGYHLKVAQNSSRNFNLKGFFDNKKDWRVKQKLLLMGGSVGFGWTRKSTLKSHKSWGLFALPAMELRLMRYQ